MAKGNLRIRVECITNNNKEITTEIKSITCCLQNKQLLRAYKSRRKGSKRWHFMGPQLFAVPHVKPFLTSVFLKGAGNRLTSSAWMEWHPLTKALRKQRQVDLFDSEPVWAKYRPPVSKQSSSSFTKNTFGSSKKRSREEARCQSLNRQAFLQQHTQNSQKPLRLLHTVMTEYNQGSSSNS